jgi:hypothetical protein
MTSRWTAVAAAILIGTGVAGCGGSGDEETSDAASAAASVVPSDNPAGASADADLDGEADEGKQMTADDFCGFLATETPKVVDVQPAEFAAATFKGALLEFYTSKGLMTGVDGADMDALVAEGGPEKASALLPALGASDFVDLLSR